MHKVQEWSFLYSNAAHLVMSWLRFLSYVENTRMTTSFH